MSPEQLHDVLDCGNAQENWQAIVRTWRARASFERSTATQLLADALDAQERAAEHDEDAGNFDALANALESANVTFPVSASAIEAQRAGTTQIGAVHESAVPNGETPPCR